MTELLDEAQRQVHDFVGGLAAETPVVSELTRLLEQLHAAEVMTDNARLRLALLIRMGVATQADVRDYDTLRHNIFRAQMRLYTTIADATPAMFITQIPRPQMAPEVLAPETLAEGRALGLRALGNPAAGAAATAGVLASPWFWAGIVLTVLVALGILAAIVVGISLSADAISGVAIAWVQSKAYGSFLERRWAAYQGCLAEGRSPAECAELARQLVPPPELTTLSSNRLWATLKWVLIAGGASAAGFFGYRWLRKQKRKRLIRLLADDS